MLNVNDRRQEIGLYRALGNSSANIMALFLGKAVLVGLIGAVLGNALGAFLAVNLGPKIFPVTAAAIVWPWSLMCTALWVAPLFTMVASFIPAAAAASQDPAIVLRDV